MFTFIQIRVVFRHQWRLCQRIQNKVNKDSSKHQEEADFNKSDAAKFAHCTRGDQHIHIHPVTEQNDHTHHRKDTYVTFSLTRHEHQHWNNKVDHKHSPVRELVILNTEIKIDHLFRDVGIPVKHELRE